MDIEMKSVFAALLFLAAATGLLFADGAADWIQTTDRSDDPEIIRLMDEGDLERKLEAAKALGLRRDPFVGNVIGHFLALYRHDRQYEYELVIESILASVFPPQAGEAERAARSEANRETLAALIAACDGFGSGALKAACIRLGAAAGTAGVGPLAAREGGRLLERLRRNRGSADRADTEEILAILDAIAVLGMKDFGALPADFARFSGDKRVVERARALAGTLE